MRKTFVRWQLVCYLLILVSATAQTGRPMPTVTGENLAGHKVVLPDAARGSVAVLIFGFSKASKTPTSAWAKRLSSDFAVDAGFQIYQLPVLEDVPRLFRGMVISGIKKGVPESLRDRFVPILDGEEQLKKAVDYGEPDDAYLVLLDRNSKVVRLVHGPVSDAGYASLQTNIRSLLAEK